MINMHKSCDRSSRKEIQWITKSLTFATAMLLTSAYAGAAEITVTMADGEYAPATVTASVGDVIRFVNDDEIDHNVFVTTVGHAIDLGNQKPGDEISYELGKMGAFEVECVFHSNMLMTVEVK